MAADPKHFYQFGPFRIDVSEQTLSRDGQIVAITPKVFDMLLVLVRNSGATVDKQTLMKEVWPDSFVEEGNLTVNMTALRRALGENSDEHPYIETMPRRGYRFVAEVTENWGHDRGPDTGKRRPGLKAVAPSRSTSSTEYIISGIKQHRKTATVGLILLLVLSIGLYIMLRPSRPSEETTLPLTSVGSLAVLPFVNESGNSEVEYLSDGMTESLINSLSQLANLSVKARSTVFRYKGKNLEPQQVGSELKVQAVLNGRVMQRGEQLALGLELVDVRTGNHIWGEQYNSKLSDLMTLQSEIARDVSNKLRLKLSGADERKVTRSYTANAEAYQLYLRGRFFWDKRTPPSMQKAVEYFEQAIAADRGYALAYAGLADAYAALTLYNRHVPPREMMPKAKEAAHKALSLDDNLAEAHAALGFLLYGYDYDFARAELELKRALELNPKYVSTHLSYGVYLIDLGRFDQGFGEFQRSLELDPLSLANNLNYGMYLHLARRYDEAITQLKKTIELDANFPGPHLGLAYAYWSKGMYAEGVKEWIKRLELLGNPQLAALSRESFAKGGMRELRRAMVGKFVFPPYDAYGEARNLAQMGEKDRAFAELNKAYENREFIVSLKVDPFLDPLRDDPRFRELLARIGFPQ
jgi:TolB-like protein/DNA-binding winged helix-turn-helix (wHTH) protein/Tfp pilus assembly protein PilF